MRIETYKGVARANLSNAERAEVEDGVVIAGAVARRRGGEGAGTQGQKAHGENTRTHSFEQAGYSKTWCKKKKQII